MWLDRQWRRMPLTRCDRISFEIPSKLSVLVATRSDGYPVLRCVFQIKLSDQLLPTDSFAVFERRNGRSTTAHFSLMRSLMVV